jgi:hypothetical protein
MAQHLQSLPPATITIEAEAFDSDGSIQSVKFYKGSTLLSTARPLLTVMP